MRARKAAVALREPPPDEEAGPFPPDDAGDGEAAPFEETLSFERVCLICGGGHEGCEHRERVSFHLPSPVIRSRIERLRRAAAEHRAAERALRALSLSEHARGRAEIEVQAAPAVEIEPPPWVEAAAPAVEIVATTPCPRCADREATPSVEASAPPAAAPRKARKKAAPKTAQATFAFLGETEAPA